MEVKPRQVGEIIQTDLGDLKYVMHPEDMTVLWDMTGWATFGGLILRLCCFALLLSACSPAGAAAQPTATPSPTIFPGQVSNPLFSGTETSPSRIYAKGAWKLYIYYRLKGTRSEGQHGVLYQDGQEVKFGQPGITLQTELGEMKYYL